MALAVTRGEKPLLPDIFRTIQGSEFRMGPADRFMGSDVSSLPRIRGVNPATDTKSIPRIIVRDKQGNVLDTFTHLQEAIYRAKWKVKQTHEATTPLEWRLPKAPVPSRPDFSRTLLPQKSQVHTEIRTSQTKKTIPDNTVVINVEDVGFVAESLQHLPQVPSLSFLRHDILVGPKTYFQIVGRMLLHHKFLMQTDRREPQHEFPGLCSGCLRMGLCYGCERSSEPHYHEDRLMKTGGGFTYFRKDRPERIMPWKNPANWRVKQNDQALKHMVREFAEAGLAHKLPENLRQYLHDTTEGHHPECPLISKLTQESYDMETQPVEILPTSKLENFPDDDNEMDEGIYVDKYPDSGSKVRGRKKGLENLDDHLLHPSPYHKKGDNRDEYGYDEQRNMSAHSEGDVYDLQLRVDLPNEMLVLSPWQTEVNHGKEEGDHGKNQYEGFERRHSSSDEEAEVGDMSDDENSTERGGQNRSGGRARKKLYRAPPAFKPRKSARRQILSRSPFSTNRTYDIKLGSGFQPQKSDKSPTQFKDFKKLDRTWTAPKKFEVKPQEKSATKFWTPSPPRDTKTDKNKTRRNGDHFNERRHRSVSPRPPSIDSGLASELLTAAARWKSKLPGSTDAQFSGRPDYRSPIGRGDLDSSFQDPDTQVQLIPKIQESGFARDKASLYLERTRLTCDMSGYLTGPADTLHTFLTPETTFESGGGDGRPTEVTESVKESTTEEEDISPQGMDVERVHTPVSSRLPFAESAKTEESAPVKKERKEILKKERKEIVKKEKKEKPSTPPKLKSPSPLPPVEEPEPTFIEEDLQSREDTYSPQFVREVISPDLPPLPEYKEREKPLPRLKHDNRKMIEVLPEMKEPKKKLPPPPKVYRIPKSTPASHRSKPAEAPVTSTELREMTDTLDFLTKYCIIYRDKLPFYENVFSTVVSVQTPRYQRVPQEIPRSGTVSFGAPVWSEHELNMLRDLTVINHCQKLPKEGLNPSEQYMEKLSYTLELLMDKKDNLMANIDKLEAEKIRHMAEVARQKRPHITRVDYKPKKSKKRKKKKKKVKDWGEFPPPPAPPKPKTAADITDEIIVSRIDDKLMKKLKKDPKVRQIKLEVDRIKEKMKEIDERMNEVDDEKEMVQLYCMECYFNSEKAFLKSPLFKRQQSMLYQKLHPDKDVEMNLEELEVALQQINNNLLTHKEFEYIKLILDLPGRRKINFRLFSIIAALSEKVTQMDPVVRKLINKMDYHALDVKMERSKELFGLLQEGEGVPEGNAHSANLAVELTAGGLTPEHTNYVLHKFDRDGNGYFDFLDFVMYIPLFIEIHQRIVEDPLNQKLDL
ncbi:hypothetical protein CHS0354_028492 [Potamilus streckersoni]|uniref:EF-hand domain-containing protein n=1 Tax=Potamilus streckersoni TaxID=2493646 RepID=A0AAE0VQN0_9BIVA|nr:hypothetical protein CHS0354_028492 [Potamilus streckersoni]